MTLHAYCPKRGCGARLVASTNGQGAVVVACPPCERNKAGRCRDCPAPLASKGARRCPRCKKARHKLTCRLRYQEQRDAILAQQREYNRRPEVRAHRKAYKDRYNAEYFGDAVGRRAHIEATKRWRMTPEGRTASRAAKKRHYQRNADRIRADRRERYQQNREVECAKQRARHAAKRQGKAA